MVGMQLGKGPLLFCRLCGGLAVPIAVDPQSSGTVAAGVARGAIDGVILGSNAWPSVPVDVQARLVLWSPECNEQRQCGWVSTTPIDE
jgi:hypothetical protein